MQYLQFLQPNHYNLIWLHVSQAFLIDYCSRYRPCYLQLTSPIISWEFEDSINEVININLLGVGHTISVREAKFFDCVSFDDVMLLHCERTPSIGGICLDYAFSTLNDLYRHSPKHLQAENT